MLDERAYKKALAGAERLEQIMSAMAPQTGALNEIINRNDGFLAEDKAKPDFIRQLDEVLAKIGRVPLEEIDAELSRHSVGGKAMAEKLEADAPGFIAGQYSQHQAAFDFLYCDEPEKLEGYLGRGNAES